MSTQVIITENQLGVRLDGNLVSVLKANAIWPDRIDTITLTEQELEQVVQAVAEAKKGE